MNKKTIKFNREIIFNPATCVVLAVLVYVLFCVLRFVSKEPITVYKVNKSNVSNNIELTGLAVRDEKIIKSSTAGYICYYVRDGEKAMKYSTVCAIDKSGEVYNFINEDADYQDLFTEENYSDIRSIISLYKANYDDVSFYNSYIFQNNITNKVLDLTGEILMQQVNSNGVSSRGTPVTTPYSGIATYYVDGFENYKIDSVSKDDFDKSKYSKQTLKSGDSVEAGTPIIKIIPSEEWNIIAPISQEQINSLGDRSNISFYINNSSFTAYMPFEIIHGSDGSYINIKMNKYLINYLSERYLSIEIVMEEDMGLKVPVSAIVDKQVYKIPLEFFSGGSNQNYSNQLNIQVKDDNGEITITQVSPTIYYRDDNYCYVDPASFKDTDVLYNITNNKTQAVSLLGTDTVKGVYTANRGVAEFKRISIIKTVDEFALVESDENLKIYDNIIMNADTVTDNQLIY